MRSTKVFEMTKPMMNEKQMMKELARLRTCGGNISAVTTCKGLFIRFGFFLVLYNASLDKNENDLMESDII